MKKQPDPEWSVPFDVASLGPKPLSRKIVADRDSCADLAVRFDVAGLADVQAALTLERIRGGHVIHVTGTVQALVHQTCSLTGDPMETIIQDTIEAYFSEPSDVISFAKGRVAADVRAGETEVPMVDEADAPEPIINGTIDLGEIAAQFLSLAIDPYPRSVKGEEPLVIAHGPTDEEDERRKPHPFDQLKAWREKL